MLNIGVTIIRDSCRHAHNVVFLVWWQFLPSWNRYDGFSFALVNKSLVGTWTTHAVLPFLTCTHFNLVFLWVKRVAVLLPLDWKSKMLLSLPHFCFVLLEGILLHVTPKQNLQIIAFLQQNSHPRVAERMPSIPENVTDQVSVPLYSYLYLP